MINVGSLGPLPPGFPKFGRYKGRRVELSKVEAELSPAQWPMVEAVVDGETLRPWAGVTHSVTGPDGESLGPF